MSTNQRLAAFEKFIQEARALCAANRDTRARMTRIKILLDGLSRIQSCSRVQILGRPPKATRIYRSTKIRITTLSLSPSCARRAATAACMIIIVGHVTTHSPWSEGYFLKEVKPHLDEGQIRYIERLAYRELVKIMDGAKGFLFPLQWDEPFGVVVIEDGRWNSGAGLQARLHAGIDQQRRDGLSHRK